MYLTLLLFSVASYGLQNALVGHIARRTDLLWVCTARGLSLAVVMAPLLLFAPADAWGNVIPNLGYLFAACACALMANLAQTFAVRHLPMAISVAIGQALAAIVTLIYEVVGGAGLPPVGQLVCIAGVMTGVIILGWISGRGQRLGPNAKPLLGIIACLVFGVAMASALVPLGIISRNVDPFIAAWAWESGIGLLGLLAACCRLPFTQIPTISIRQGLHIGMCSSPTLIGTGAYTYATTLGSLTIAGGVLSAMMVGTAISARLIFKETLSLAQWTMIGATCACLVALGVVQWAGW